MIPSYNLHDFGGCIDGMYVSISHAKYNDPLD